MLHTLSTQLCNLRLEWAAVLLLNIASSIFGRNARISLTRKGLWKHQSDTLAWYAPLPAYDFRYADAMKELESIYFYEYRPKMGDVCVDIGAGLGMETIFMCRSVGDSGRVLSVEASPRTFEVLQMNVCSNSLKNCRTFNVAISSASGIVCIEDNLQMHNHNRLTKYSDHGLCRVQGVTMDEFLEWADVGEIDYLKVNIEGAEKYLIESFARICNVRNVAISCHDFLGRREGNEELFTRKLVESFLLKNRFAITSRNTGFDYIDDWIYGKRL